MNLFEITIAFVNGLGLMALVAVVYGTVERLRAPRWTRGVLHGALFGLGAIVTMMTPAVLAPGVLVDARTILVGLAGAFAGPVAAVIATIFAAAYRIWLGGAGLPVGLTTLTVALAAGLVWRYLWFKRRSVTPFGLLLLGLGIASQVVAIPLLPAKHLTPSFIMMFAGSLAASSLFATQVLGAMMNRENRLIAREKALIDDAYTDALTGLPNRRALYGAEAGLLAASDARGFVVLLVDVDHFKSINDRFGHDVGDAALCILSQVLKEAARAGDVVARFGGEEFVVALPNTRAEEGWGVARRMCALVRERLIVLPEASLSLTISIGLAHARKTSLADTIARADAGLYLAKAGGRDRVAAAPAPLQAPAAAPATVPAPAASPAFATADQRRP